MNKRRINREKGRQRYLEEWGNYKSDKWKSKSLLRSEIQDILCHGTFSKDQLILLKEHAKAVGIDWYDSEWPYRSEDEKSNMEI